MVCSISYEQKSAIYLNLLKPMVESCLQKEEERKLAARWIEILMNSIGQSELGRKYLKLLLFILPRKRLLGLFTDLPGTDLKELPEKVLDIALRLISSDEPCDLSIAAGQPSCPKLEETCDLHKMEIRELSQQEHGVFAVSTTKPIPSTANIPRKPLVNPFINQRKKVVLPPLPPIRPPPDLIIECEQTIIHEPKSPLDMNQARKRFFDDGRPTPKSPTRSLKSCISMKGEQNVKEKHRCVVHATPSPYEKESNRTVTQREIFVPNPKYRVGYETHSNVPKFETSKEKKTRRAPTQESHSESLVYIRRTLCNDSKRSSALLVTESKVYHASKERNVINTSTELRQTIFPNVEATLLDASLKCNKFQNVNSEPLVSSDDSVLSLELRAAQSTEFISHNFESKKSSENKAKNITFNTENEIKLKTASKSMPVLEVQPDKIENTVNHLQEPTVKTDGYFQTTTKVTTHQNRQRSCKRLANLSQQIWVHLADVSDKKKFNSLDDSLIDLDQIDLSNILNETSNLADASLPPGYSDISDEERLVHQMSAAADAIEHDLNSPNLRHESPPSAFFSDPSFHSNKDIIDETLPSISSVGPPSFHTPPPRRIGGTPTSARLQRPESHGLPSPVRYEPVVYRPAYKIPRNDMSPRGRPVPRETWNRRRLIFDQLDQSADQSIFDVSAEDSRMYADQKRRVSEIDSASGTRIPTQLPQPRESPLTSTPDQNKRSRRISFSETGYYSRPPAHISGVSPPHLISVSSGRNSPQNRRNVSISNPRTLTLLEDSSFEISANTPPQYSRGSPISPRRQRDQYDSSFESLGAVSPPLYSSSPPVLTPMHRSVANISNLSGVDSHLISITPPVFLDIDDSYASPPAFFSPESASQLEHVTPPDFFSSEVLVSPQRKSPQLPSQSFSPLFSMSPPVFATSPKTPTPPRPRTPEFPSGSFSPLMGVTPPAFANSLRTPTPPRPVTPDFPSGVFSPLAGVSPPMFASSTITPTPPRPVTPQFPSDSRSLLMSMSPPMFVDLDGSLPPPPEYPESFGSSLGAYSPQFLASPPRTLTPIKRASPVLPSDSRSLLMSVSPPEHFADDSMPLQTSCQGSLQSSIANITAPSFASSLKTPEIPHYLCTPITAESPPVFAETPPVTPLSQLMRSRSPLWSQTQPSFPASPQTPISVRPITPPFPQSYGSPLSDVSQPQFYSSPQTLTPTRQRTPVLPSPPLNQTQIWLASPPVYPTTPQTPPFPNDTRSSIMSGSLPAFTNVSMGMKTPSFPYDTRSSILSGSPPAFTNVSMGMKTPSFPNDTRSSILSGSPPAFTNVSMGMKTHSLPNDTRSSILSGSLPRYVDITMGPQTPPFPASYGSQIAEISPPMFASSPKTPPSRRSPAIPSANVNQIWSVSTPVCPPCPPIYSSLRPKTPELPNISHSPLSAVSPPMFVDVNSFSFSAPPQYPIVESSPLANITPPSFAQSPQQFSTPPFPFENRSFLLSVSPPVFPDSFPSEPNSISSKRYFNTPPYFSGSSLAAVSPPKFADSLPSPEMIPPRWPSYHQSQNMLTEVSPPRFNSTLNDSSDFVTSPPIRRRSTSQPCISATSPPQFYESPPQKPSSRGGSPVSQSSSHGSRYISIGNVSPELVTDDSFEDIPNMPNYYLNRPPTLSPTRISSLNLPARRRESMTRQNNPTVPRIPITLDPQIAAPIVSAQRPVSSSTPKRRNYSPPIRVRIQSQTGERPTGSRYNADFNLGANKITEVDVPQGSSILIDSRLLSAVSLDDSYNSLSTTMPSYAQSFNESLGGTYRSYSPNVFDVSQPALVSLGSYDTPTNASRAYSLSMASTPDFMNDSYNNLFDYNGNVSGTSFNTASGGIADTSRPYLVSSSFSDYSGEFLSDIHPVDLTNVSMNSSCGRCG